MEAPSPLSHDDVNDAYQQYATDLLRFALVLTRDPDTAADLVQDAYLIALETPSGPLKKSAMKSWLMRILHNRWRDQVRRQTTFRRLWSYWQPIHTLRKPPFHESIPESRLSRSQIAQRLWETMNRLPDWQKAVIYLYYIEELSTCEVAEILEIPQRTVLTRLYRARKNLLKLLNSRSPL